MEKMYLGKFQKISTLQHYLRELGAEGMEFSPGKVEEVIMFKHCLVRIKGIVLTNEECKITTELEALEV